MCMFVSNVCSANITIIMVTMRYHIFVLLSACAYISTVRKPALKNEACLVARYALIGIAANKYTWNICQALKMKGGGQLFRLYSYQV